jgi:signal transduction histidine kinase
MRLNLRLFYKLVAIALIPFVFEGILAVSLFNMVASAQTQALNERKARRASADLNDLYQRTTDTARLVGVVVLKQKAPSAAEFNRQQQTMAGDLKDIRELVQDDPAMLKQVDELEQNINASLRVVGESLSDVESHDQMAAVSKLKYLRTTAPVVTEKLSTLRNYFEEKADEHFYRQQDSHKSLQTLIWIGIVFNLLLVLALALVAGIERNIRSRLMVLVENTHRLAKQQPLLPPVGGTDEIAHLDKVFTDMAQALEEARKQREEIERLKQEFVSMISHDLRTPLTSIQVFVSMLAKGMYGDIGDKIKDKASMADRNASRLIRLINDLLDMEKMEAGQLALACEEVPLGSIVERSLESVRDFADKNKVTLEGTTGSAELVNVDADRIVQVLVNLLSNAIKFSPAGAAVTVSVEDGERWMTVKVIDRGRGVPQHLQTSIFERFKQVEAKDATEKKGTGLGLAICKAIVEQHGGTIGLESTEGKGSIFHFTLPKAQTVDSIEATAVKQA